MKFADKIINFNSQLNYMDNLPKGFEVLNPFIENPETMQVIKTFYNKFYEITSNESLFWASTQAGMELV